jgi:hypothetical protein
MSSIPYCFLWLCQAARIKSKPQCELCDDIITQAKKPVNISRANMMKTTQDPDVQWEEKYLPLAA